MKMYLNCQTVHTGINKPHTIIIDGHNVSISYTNKLNNDCIYDYYKNKLKMKHYANATDKNGKQYKVYVQYINNPFYSIIAITKEV